MNDAAFHPLHEAFSAAASWLDGDATAEPVSTNADRLAAMFGLGTFERNILLLTAYVALEAEAGEQLAKLKGAPERRQLTVGILLSCVPFANWSALAADSALREHRLITLSQGPSLAGLQVSIAESALFFLLGAPAFSSSLADYIAVQDSSPLLSPSRRELAELIFARSRADLPSLLMLTGTDAEGKVQAMKAVCDRMGAKLCLLHASLVPTSIQDLLPFARELQRDLTLVNGSLLLRVEGQAEEAPVRLLVQALAIPIAVACDEPLVFNGRTAVRIETPRMMASQQSEVWREYLGPGGLELDAAITDLSSNFRVTPELAQTVRIALDIGGEAEDVENENKAALRDRIWATCRESVRPRMNELAERIETTAEWDDLVLPPRQKDLLRNLTDQARQRTRVYEEWGFGTKLQERGLGISALLSGPSGTGKTMAGQIIANTLGLDLYCIDLSSVVSKWLGETEKNIRRLFDAAEEGGVVMQFDEADALFGKRSEVKDSHDRHANIEVSYLLQKLEAYRGIAILTTNLRDNIDQAFMRRIRFVVEFPFPGAAERESIWQRIFPSQVPLAGIDFQQLSRLNIAGGTIRNVALAAAFEAARRNEPVTMGYILASARVEYDKVGRMMSDNESAGWAA